MREQYWERMGTGCSQCPFGILIKHNRDHLSYLVCLILFWFLFFICIFPWLAQSLRDKWVKTIWGICGNYWAWFVCFIRPSDTFCFHSSEVIHPSIHSSIHPSIHPEKKRHRGKSMLDVGTTNGELGSVGGDLIGNWVICQINNNNNNNDNKDKV